MPDVSIVIKATYRFSGAMKAIRDSSGSFTKDLAGLQSKPDALNRTKTILKVDADNARKESRSAEEQFVGTRDEVSEMILASKQLTFEQAHRNLSLVTKEAANTEKAMLRVGKALSKSENQAGSSTVSLICTLTSGMVDKRRRSSGSCGTVRMAACAVLPGGYAAILMYPLIMPYDCTPPITSLTQWYNKAF